MQKPHNPMHRNQARAHTEQMRDELTATPMPEMNSQLDEYVVNQNVNTSETETYMGNRARRVADDPNATRPRRFRNNTF